jgi:hypothetical protein
MDPATRRLVNRAEAIAGGEALQGLVMRALGQPRLQEELRRDPSKALADAGVKIPRGMEIKFSPQPRVTGGRPTPDWLPFSIRLTRCRTVWVADPDDDPPIPKQQTVCFGFEIIRHRPPGGPIG